MARPLETARVVIGSNFGDEGKGVLTDHYAAPAGPDALVVRFNGGAQAGHTVVDPLGRRHVFSHFGAGGLAGSPTFLSRFFVTNPLIFLREAAEIDRLGLKPRVIVDPNCIVTTPYDMIINEAVEDARGAARHGSVGIGFGETIERCLRPNYALTVADLCRTDDLRRQLQSIRNEWVPARFAALGFPGLQASRADILLSDGLIERWLQDVTTFLGSTEQGGVECISRAREVVFEGAQGLLLDEGHRWFPHVTRSRTGISNAADLAFEAGLSRLEITYCTRAYLTRHGAGPLPGELTDQPYDGIVDETNRPHRYQGRLRFAHLDLEILQETVRADIAKYPQTLDISHVAAVTCLDQLPAEAMWRAGGKVCRGSPEALASAAAKAIGAGGLLVSTSAARGGIVQLSSEPRLGPSRAA